MRVLLSGELFVGYIIGITLVLTRVFIGIPTSVILWLMVFGPLITSVILNTFWVTNKNQQVMKNLVFKGLDTYFFGILGSGFLFSIGGFFLLVLSYVKQSMILETAGLFAYGIGLSVAFFSIRWRLFIKEGK